MSQSEGEPSILIVEDYADLAESLTRLLRRMGYAADMVNSGGQAMHYLLNNVPALVILDLHMPDYSGLELLRLIRASKRTSTLPVIIYTSSSDKELLGQCLEAGANEVWLKGTIDFFHIVSR